MYKRTHEEWLEMCENITAGFLPFAEKKNVYLTCHYLVDRLRRWCYPAGLRLLDWGCGNGRLPMGLVNDLPHLDYTGIDVIKPAIDFCQIAFKPWKNFYKFQHVNVKNGRYWNKGIDPSEFVLPFDNGSFDVVFCNSLFTHTGKLEIADRFIREAHRVLLVGGIFISTWIIRDEPAYDEAVTIYTESMVQSLYDGKFEVIGKLDCPETPNHQTEIAARKI